MVLAAAVMVVMVVEIYPHVCVSTEPLPSHAVPVEVSSAPQVYVAPPLPQGKQAAGLVVVPSHGVYSPALQTAHAAHVVDPVAMLVWLPAAQGVQSFACDMPVDPWYVPLLQPVQVLEPVAASVKLPAMQGVQSVAPTDP